MTDLFILAAEPSADLQGAKLIEELLKQRPDLKIAAMAGPRMRLLAIDTLFEMESLQVMGFIDVVRAMPSIMRQFFRIRNTILSLNPKAVVCIDYPGFNLRLERSLRKKGYRGKLIHYICPTVWAWGKKRIPLMAKNLDLLLTLFPFEKECFAQTNLRVEYVGHPLTSAIGRKEKPKTRILALFPGSREKEIERNLPWQLEVAQELQKKDPSLEIAISAANRARAQQIEKITSLRLVPPEKSYELMRDARLALATSGTVTLELALHNTPAVVHFAIRPFDVFLAQKIFKINLPFYCIVNIVANREIYPELFGPNFTKKALLSKAEALWFDAKLRTKVEQGCDEVRKLLGDQEASRRAAEHIAKISAL